MADIKQQSEVLQDYKLPPKQGYEKYGLDLPDAKVEEYLEDMRKYKETKQRVEGRTVISKKIEDDNDYYSLGI